MGRSRPVPKRRRPTKSARASAVVERAELRALGQLGEAAAEIDVRVVVDAASPVTFSRAAREEHLDLGAAREQVARHDEAVAAVVAGAAHDDDARVERVGRGLAGRVRT